MISCNCEHCESCLFYKPVDNVYMSIRAYHAAPTENHRIIEVIDIFLFVHFEFEIVAKLREKISCKILKYADYSIGSLYMGV